MFREVSAHKLAPAAVHVALCLAHLWYLHRSPLLRYLTVDLESYDLWARDIAGGQWLGARVFYQDPLYPYLMALIYKLFGADILHVLLVQIAASALTVLLVQRLARDLFSERAALLAGWIAALYQPAIFYACKPEKACLSAFGLTLILCWSLEAWRQARGSSWIRCGVLYGLVSLLRANVLLLAAAAALVLAFRRPRALAGFLAGLALVLLPVLMRNHAVGSDWVLTTSQGGANLFIGNNAANTSGSYTAPSFVRPSPRFEQEDFHRHAEFVSGRPLLPSQGSAFYLREVARWATAEPVAFIRLQLVKVYAFLNAYEIPDNWSIDFLGRYSPLLELPLLRYGWLVPFALLGGVLTLFQPAARGPRGFVLFVLAYCSSVIAFFIFSRYRFPITPAFHVLAASACLELSSFIRAGRRRALGLSLAGLLAAGAVAYSTPTVDPAGDLSHRHFNLAASFFQDGRLDEAAALCEQALQIAPANHLALFTLSRIAGLKGDPRKELDLLFQAHRASPDDEDVLVQVARANARSGGYPAAARFARQWLETRESYQLRRALVEIAVGHGVLEAAREETGQLLQRYPGDAWALEKSRDLLSGAVAPDSRLQARAVLEQVEALVRQKRHAEAVALLQQEIAAGRAEAATFQYLSNLHYLGGDLLRARDALARAAEMEPGNPLYKSNLRALDAALQRGGP